MTAADKGCSEEDEQQCCHDLLNFDDLLNLVALGPVSEPKIFYRIWITIQSFGCDQQKFGSKIGHPKWD